MIEAQGLYKRYGETVALEDVSLSIGKGEVVGLLGPNGAGKTTLIRILTGYFEPSGGSITIDGLDVQAEPLAPQQLIGYLPEQTPLYPEMLVQEYLEMVADFRQLPTDQRLRLIAEAVWATDLEEFLTRPIAALSKGMRQRVGLAQAILHKPKVLILDEPTSGLDPTQVVHVRELIRRLAQDTTVLFSTHILSEVEQVCERAVVLLGGRVHKDAHLADLRSSQRARVAIVESEPGSGQAYTGAGTPDTDAQARLEKIAGAQTVTAVAGLSGHLTFEVAFQEGRDGDGCRQVFRLAKEAGWELGELRPVVRDLETVFRDLVREHEQGAPTPASTSESLPQNVTRLEVSP